MEQHAYSMCLYRYAMSIYHRSTYTYSMPIAYRHTLQILGQTLALQSPLFLAALTHVIPEAPGVRLVTWWEP